MNQYTHLWLDEVKELFPKKWERPAILEIGSWNVFGIEYGVRERFPNCQRYVGIDIQSGLGVDIVMDAHNLDFAEREFDIVLCLDMLQHDSDMGATLAEAHRVLCDRGLLILTTMMQNAPTSCKITHDVDKVELAALLARFREMYLKEFLRNGLQGWAIK